MNVFYADRQQSGAYLSLDLVTQGVVVTPPTPPSGVPEPATWASMIVGFGLTGGMMRRRARKVSHA